MAKPILKRFRPSGRTIILVPSDPAPIPDSKENPFSGDINTRGWEKLAIFYGNLRLFWKQWEIGRWLLWNINRKSWVPDWMVSFSMTLS